ncbi:unnamed protein product [Cochlearia groenlandica]
MSTRRISESPPLISITILFIIVLESTATMIIINARELRPSDHGLEYYYEPDDDESSKEMTSFFGPPSSSSSTNEMTSSSPYGSTLPSAVKSPMTTSSRDNDDDDDDDDGHVMRHVLVVGSLVCGVSGVALMVASGLIYFFGYSRHSSDS